MTTTRKVTILVGPPCCGKSTYIKSQQFDYIVSSDNVVEIVCAQNKISYTQFFDLDFNHATRRNQRKMFHHSIEESMNYKNVVWDLTNLTKTERQRAMQKYSDTTFHAVEFCFHKYEEDIIVLNKKRGIETGKFIPEQVMRNMFDRYEPVELNEGFSEISNVNMIENIVNSECNSEVQFSSMQPA